MFIYYLVENDISPLVDIFHTSPKPLQVEPLQTRNEIANINSSHQYVTLPNQMLKRYAAGEAVGICPTCQYFPDQVRGVAGHNFAHIHAHSALLALLPYGSDHRLCLFPLHTFEQLDSLVTHQLQHAYFSHVSPISPIGSKCNVIAIVEQVLSSGGRWPAGKNQVMGFEKLLRRCEKKTQPRREQNRKSPTLLAHVSQPTAAHYSEEELPIDGGFL